MDPVEEAVKVQVYDPPITLSDIASGSPYGVMCPPPRAISIARFREVWVEDGREDLQQCLLEEAVEHCRNTQVPHATIRFGYLHPPYRLWLVPSLK